MPIPRITLSQEQKAECQARIAHAKNNPTEGEPAIALGRGAGAAKLLGDESSVTEIWQKLEQLKPGSTCVKGMPNLDELLTGYSANPSNFAEFGDTGHFSAGGNAFSNAVGSYARALAQISERVPAQVEGEENWAYHWGAKALKAAGLDKAAELIAGAPDSVMGKWESQTKEDRNKGGARGL